MINFNDDTDNLLLDFETFTEADIFLTSEQINRAVELSEPIVNTKQQWQTYLNALALEGFKNWLEERDFSMEINSANCSVTQPQYANYLDGVFNLEVGAFKVCLLTDGVAIDELVTIPRAILDLPQYTAHFYILLDVIEERAEARINSFLRYDEILERIENNNLTPESDWTYEIPLAWFNSESDDLLLYLRCLDTQAITLPEITASSSNNIQSELEILIPQLQSAETSLADILTWEQGARLLGDSDLLTWLYELQTQTFSLQDAINRLSNSFSQTVQQINQRVINVKSWLSNELDEIAQNLAWNLLPTPVASTAFRDLQVVNRESPTEEFTAILSQLRDSGEEIPNLAAGAYRDFNLANYALRLFAVTWEISETENVPEWSLLLILGARLDSYLPQGLKLELSQDSTVLDETVVEIDTDDTYIYSQVIGELDEQFFVSVTLASGESITLPKFIFQ
jgi:hypothetical protein